MYANGLLPLGCTRNWIRGYSAHNESKCPASSESPDDRDLAAARGGAEKTHMAQARQHDAKRCRNCQIGGGASYSDERAIAAPSPQPG